VLRHLPDFSDPNLLVGVATGDDAAVYRLNDDTAVILTVDFFPPIVDDPYAFGAIAAANALSDIYATGARPLLGLNIVAFPTSLPSSILGEVLKGGSDKAGEAGMLIVGGHTIDDEEPKYGLAVTGLVQPGRQVTNAGAQPGDLLVLTKPIGTGVITTAGKNDLVDTDVLDGAVQSMTTLNHEASHAMTEVGVHACVDVTGYGLIGHLLGMLRASNATARISLGQVPVLDGVWDLLEQNVAPGGTRRNLTAADPAVLWNGAGETAKLLLCDAQTSGGLLIAVPHARKDLLVRELESRRVEAAALIGEVAAPGAFGDHLVEVAP
jgi:selenide,water dikinase